MSCPTRTIRPQSAVLRRTASNTGLPTLSITASTPGHPSAAELAGKILSPLDHDDLVRAGLADPRRLGCRRRHRDRKRASQPRQLNAVEPKPPAGAGDQYASPSRTQPTSRTALSSVPIVQATMAASFAGTRGYLEGGVRIDADQLGIATIEPGIAEKDPLRTGSLMATAAVAAVPADMAVDRGGDEITDAKPAHFRAQSFDGSCDLMTEDHRHLHATPEGAVAYHHVVEANPPGPHRDPDLTRSGLARRHIDDAQIGAGAPARSRTTARMRYGRSVRREPAGDDFPLASLGFHDRARQEPAC